MRTRSAHAASCLLRVAREHLFAAAAPDPLFGSTLFACLLACLLGCLFFLRWAFAKHTVDGAAYAARASSRGDGLFVACCAGVRCRCACTGAPPPTPPSRCRTSALHQCVCVEYPRRLLSTLLPASRAPISDPVTCEHPIPHKREAVAEVAVDTEALVCSGSRCSSP